MVFRGAMHPKDAEEIANSVDPDQASLIWVCTVSRSSLIWVCTVSRSSLIWVCTVCPDLYVRKLRYIAVIRIFFIIFILNKIASTPTLARLIFSKRFLEVTKSFI